ncbi:MAG: hypothetical protein ACOCTQ_01920 [Planctomycetota bacterium]
MRERKIGNMRGVINFLRRGLSENRTMATIGFVNALILAGLATYWLIVPAGIVISDISDRAIGEPGIPRAAVRLFYRLTPKYGEWAQERVGSEDATTLSTDDISGTEWPLFGSVFYLWSVESLQKAWELDPSLMEVEPKEYARETIEVAMRLVTDPDQAYWVREHWGEDYMQRENVFYRMLRIAAFTSVAPTTREVSGLEVTGNRLAPELETGHSVFLSSGTIDPRFYPLYHWPPGNVDKVKRAIERKDGS